MEAHVMKFVGRLLFATAAGLAVLSTWAKAADLPTKSALAIDYVRTCSSQGAGFFYVPGTESCLRIGGRVRTEMLYAEPLQRRDDTLGFRVRGRIQLDHRTATAYGLLRALVRFEITRVSGLPFGQPGIIATNFPTSQYFVQFAGLTAGLVTSFFASPDLPTTHMGTLRFDDAPDVPLLGYTFSFGNGFSTSISIEDGIGRRQINPLIPIPGVAMLPYGGQRAPDIVGNVRYVGTWGTLQLAGAVHQIRDAGVAGTVVNGVPVPGREFADTVYGFAAGVQGSFNLPMITAGDSLWYAAAFVDGALAYLGTTNNTTQFGAGLSNPPAVDAYVNPLTGEIRKSRGFSVAGGLTHNWTPQLRSSLLGSYAHVDYPGGASALGPLGNVIGLPDFTEWRVGGNTFWTPVVGLVLGAEVIYVSNNPNGRILVNDPGAVASVARLINSGSAIEARLRVQRDF
jgi:hypothetical protein